MGQCNTKINRITFDTSDEQITEVTVEQEFWGDCPIGLKGVYKKTFPARIPVVDLIDEVVKGYLLW